MKVATGFDTNVLVVVRLSGATNQKTRPTWFTKDLCVRSVLDAVQELRNEGGRAETVLLVDVSSGLSLDEAASKYSASFNRIIGVHGGSASRSWRSGVRALHSAHVLRSAEVIYFVEDDHLHTPDAIVRLTRGLADYRFAYTSDEDRAAAEVEDQAEANTPPWLPVMSGVTSFAVKSSTFHRDRWKHVAMSYGGRGWDELTFRALGLGARDILGSGWSYLLAPFGQSSSVITALGSARHAVFRAVAEVLGAVAPSRSVEAMVPPGAAHAEVDKLPSGRDWAQVASHVPTSGNALGKSDG